MRGEDVMNVLATVVDSTTGMVKLITDYGLAIVISAITIVFLYKVLNTLLQQNSTTVSTILPKLDSVLGEIKKTQADYNISHTNMLVSFGKNFSQIINCEKDILDTLSKLTEDVNKLTTKINKVETILEVCLKLKDSTSEHKNPKKEE
jgi:hypothetical protein